MQQSSTPSYRCPFCHADIALSGYDELAVTLLSMPGERVQRVVEVDGVEIHRCPFDRARYEAVARERAQRLPRVRSTTGPSIVSEPELRLNWYHE